MELCQSSEGRGGSVGWLVAFGSRYLWVDLEAFEHGPLVGVSDTLVGVSDTGERLSRGVMPIDRRVDPDTLGWLSDKANPAVRYLTALHLLEPTPPTDTLQVMREEILAWKPLRQVLDLQLRDGSFPYSQRTHTAQPTFYALTLMARCGLAAGDEPVTRALDFLTDRHMKVGALSYTGGGSGVLPCYMGVVTEALIKMNAMDHEIVQSSIQWLVDHQRFDHRTTRVGGEAEWPFKAPVNFGCWDSVSCYHGVAAAFRAFAAIPPVKRSVEVGRRLDEALQYLRIHRLYKKSRSDQPLFRHMTQFFIIGAYRSDLLDMLQGIADADPTLVLEEWVQEAADDMEHLTEAGRVPLVKNYGQKLADPIPLERIGEPSRFLTYQWLKIRKTLTEAA